ncbi:MFS transporter [Gordonia sp. NPDC003585]|uniref:MFS transporter n=1 Tax=Gordonia sp. NPDC003585 TaxID=3154275 RepID=UPI0033B57BF9
MTTSGGSTGHRTPRVAVLVLAFTQFVIIVDETVVSLLGPAVADELGLGGEARHVLVTPFAAAFVCTLPLAGVLLRWADPRIVVAPATLAFAVTAGSAARAQTLTDLVASRAAQGVAGAVVTTGVLASLHLVTRGYRRRVRAFAVFSLISGSGSVTALLVVAPLATHSWRWCYWAIAAAALVCAGGWVMAARRTVRSEPEQHVEPHRDHVDPLTAWTFSATVGGNAVLAATVITASFVLQQDFGWTPTSAGLGFLPLNGAAALGAAVVGAVSPARAVGRLLAVGTVLLAAGCVLFAVVTLTPITLLAITIPVGLGIGVVFPLANHATLATATERSVARAAALGTAQQAGLAGGALIAATRSAVVFAAMGAVLVAALALAALSSTATPPRDGQ